MPHFKLEPQYSSSWSQRICDRFRPRKGTYEVSHLKSYDRETASHLDTPVPGDIELQVPIEPLKLGCQQNQGCRLLQLPPELLIHIMCFVSHSSRYMMSQTCQVLRKLDNDLTFGSFYRENLQLEDEHYRMIEVMCDEVRLVKRILLRRSLDFGNLSVALDAIETTQNFFSRKIPKEAISAWGCWANSTFASMSKSQQSCKRIVGKELRNYQTSRAVTRGCARPTQKAYKQLSVLNLFQWSRSTNDSFQEWQFLMLSENTGPDSFGWLSNLTFDTDEHPIFNDNTKGVLWCDDPSCGTGCGTRWLLMVEILKRTPLRNHGRYRQVPWRDRKSALKLPFTLEYKVFQEAAQWPTPEDMLYMDLARPISD
ncbi:uncharacterized protein FTJAE_4078 [Fusarium tjaetaba]|uniref:F-box domain-containing protein n=1 Tax=Fusarium tjaetaba TaxID=1567544 RepID=A0A8H5RV48_9HYPO|nr:uncharacterized protein FTJAE_4078 [Fusarium tjaetaba]KAF5641426.1 hypothetical protein FTJAE_4078 [Fusarium tjaetaba]